jgi:asparagine synthase (glutamine-hydrolysing)
LHRYAKTHVPEIKVMLIGQGADEFAGGYTRSYVYPRKDWSQYLEQAARPIWLEFGPREDEAVGPTPFDSPYQKARALRSEYQHIMYMNTYSLQYINLWHEDRTSMNHGTEARVPFLDHRLVELLASVPPAHHEALFWNKQIVREQLQGLLPDYPVDWPKIPFTGVPGNTTINDLFKMMLQRTVEDFEDKYLAAGGNVVSLQDFRRLYRRCLSGSPGARRLVSQLIQVMCVAIFERMCSGGPGSRPLSSVPTASPLNEI